MNYNTFKQHMKRLAGEYKDKSFPTNYSFPDFVQWLTLIPEPEKKQEEKWKPTAGRVYFLAAPANPLLFEQYIYRGGLFCNELLRKGLLSRTSEEAAATATAMLEAIKKV